LFSNLTLPSYSSFNNASTISVYVILLNGVARTCFKFSMIFNGSGSAIAFSSFSFSFSFSFSLSLLSFPPFFFLLASSYNNLNSSFALLCASASK